MAHAHELLDVKKNGSFIFSDILLIDYRQQNLAELLNELSKQQNHLESMVRRYMQEDERIIGQEKANIVNVLHMLVRNLSTVYLKIYDQEHAGEFSQIISVSEGKDGILLHGKMNPAEITVNFSMKRWVNEYLEGAIEGLIADFQTAAKDHTISLSEKVQLIEKISILLIQSLRALYLMRTGAVFT